MQLPLLSENYPFYSRNVLWRSTQGSKSGDFELENCTRDSVFYKCGALNKAQVLLRIFDQY
jgi:hypothetical protein